MNEKENKYLDEVLNLIECARDSLDYIEKAAKAAKANAARADLAYIFVCENRLDEATSLLIKAEDAADKIMWEAENA